MNANAAAFAAILKQRQDSGAPNKTPVDVNALVHSAVSQPAQRKKNGNHSGIHHTPGTTVSSAPVSYQPPQPPTHSQYSTQQFQPYSASTTYYAPYPTMYPQSAPAMPHPSYAHNPVQPALGPNGQPLYTPPPQMAYATPQMYSFTAPYATPSPMYPSYPISQHPPPPPPTSRPPVPPAPFQATGFQPYMMNNTSSSSATSHVFNQYKNSKTFSSGGSSSSSSGGFQHKRNGFQSSSSQNGTNFTKSNGRNNKFKATADPASEVYCDPCERIFASQAQYDKHLALHVPCSHPECSFAASARAVERHRQIRHELFGSQGFKTIEVEGRSFNVLVGVRPEDVSRWREDRRKKFPSAENVAMRQAGQRALKEAGGVNESEDRNCSNGKGRLGEGKRKRDTAAASGGEGGKKQKRDQQQQQDGTAADNAAGSTTKKGKKAKQADKQASQQQPQQQQSKGGLILPPPLTGGARGTLLKKLLEDQILEEENILLQGIRLLVRQHPLFLAGETTASEGRKKAPYNGIDAVAADVNGGGVSDAVGSDEMNDHEEADEKEEDSGCSVQDSDSEEDQPQSQQHKQDQQAAEHSPYHSGDDNDQAKEDDDDDDDEDEGEVREDGEASPPAQRDCMSRSTVLSLTGCSVDDYSACSVNTERAVTGSV